MYKTEIWMKKLVILVAIFFVNNVSAGTASEDCENTAKSKAFVNESTILSVSLADYYARPERGEFEKKEDFLKRANQAKEEFAAKIQKETVDGKFYFRKNYQPYDVKYDIDKESMTVGGVFFNFVPDKSKKVYSSLKIDSETRKDEYQGYKPEINSESSTSYEFAFTSNSAYLNNRVKKYSFKMTPEDAKSVRSNLALLVVGTPTSPYFIRQSDTYLIKGGVHQSYRYATTVNLTCAAIIDNRTGKVVQKIF